MFNKKTWLIVIIIFGFLNGLLLVFYQPLSEWGRKVLVRQPIWYAVYLSGGQVYIGQIKSIDSLTLVLKEVFFLEALSPVQEGEAAGEQAQVSPKQTYQLVRRGSENLLATDNRLYINRSTVLFWEKLNQESEIVQWIKRAENAK